MPLPGDRLRYTHLIRGAQFALFAVLAIGIHALESLLTLPVPWLRLGMTHIVTMLLLPFFGARFILGIFFVRVFVGSALVGKLFSPGFALSLGGGLAATLAMLGVYSLAKRFISFWGVSLVGAWFHNLVQVVLAALIIHQAATLIVLPFFLFLALVTGTINGLLANRIIGGIP